MRRITALVILALFLCSCAAKDEKEIKGFYCTQETVCKTLPKTAKYDLFRCGTDTGLTIPGLRQNFVPQGIACWEQRNRRHRHLCRGFSHAVRAAPLGFRFSYPVTDHNQQLPPAQRYPQTTLGKVRFPGRCDRTAASVTEIVFCS